jgi:DNA-binding NarL/FixJ family response regulator
MISVLLVDDHISILKSLQYLLELVDDIRVIATATNGADGITRAVSQSPNVVVMDISMPLMNGIEAARQIRLLCPLTQIIMLSMFNTPEYIHHALDVGAAGYILKECISLDLLAGIRALSQGSQFFTHSISGIAEKYLEELGNKDSAI